MAQERLIYVTRYALTKGIHTEMCSYDGTFWIGLHAHREGVDAFLTEEEARANVVKKLDRKIAAMKKQMALLAKRKLERPAIPHRGKPAPTAAK